MSEVSAWNAVDASNNATPPDGWPEGMQPSAVNDAARMMMGALRREHDRITAQIGSVTGTISTTTINATTISTTGAITASGPITGSAVNSTGNASVAGTLTAGAISVPAITYSGTLGHAIGFGWDGTHVEAYVDGGIHGTIPSALPVPVSEGGTGATTGATGPYLPLAGGTVTGTLNAPSLSGSNDSSAGMLRTTDGNLITFRYDSGASGGNVAWRINASFERYISSTLNVFDTYYGPSGGPVSVGFFGADVPGNIYITYADALSDERIKDNISETSVDALTLLSQVELSQFDVKGPVAAWIKTIGQDMPERIEAMRDAQPVHVPIGFVAQRLQPFVPEAVNTVRQDKQPPESPLPVDVMNVNKAELVPYLVRAIQQLAARVEQLEAGGA